MRCNDDDLASLFRRGPGTFDEAVQTESAFEDFDPDTIGAYRRLRAQINPEAPEIGLDDQELTKSIVHALLHVVAGLSDSSSRTRGITLRPYSSMLRIIRSCDSVPALYFKSNRLTSSSRTVFAIFRATVSGDPT